MRVVPTLPQVLRAALLGQRQRRREVVRHLNAHVRRGHVRRLLRPGPVVGAPGSIRGSPWVQVAFPSYLRFRSNLAPGFRSLLSFRV